MTQPYFCDAAVAIMNMGDLMIHVLNCPNCSSSAKEWASKYKRFMNINNVKVN